MIDKLQDLLNHLSPKLNTELTVDSNGACTILFDSLLAIQLELDESSENLLVFCSICELPPGKFRENVLLSALKENNKFPYVGIFGYYTEENSLSFFDFLNFSELNAEILSNYLSTFTELAFHYHASVSKGSSSLTTPQLK